MADAVPAQVLRLERLSDQHLVHLRLQGSPQELIAACSPGHNAQAGQQVQVQITQSLWFDAADHRIRP